MVVGAVAALVVKAWRDRRRRSVLGAEVIPPEVPHVIDLLRRAHQAGAACFLAPGADLVCSLGEPPPPATVLERMDAMARLAAADGREHVIREGQAVVAVGDGELAAALLLGFTDLSADDVAAAAGDLRRLLAGAGVERHRQFGAREDPRRVPEWVVAGAESLEGLGYALCEAVRAVSGRASAVVVRSANPAGAATVVAVSQGGDRRLIGRPVKVESAVGRAMMGDVPTIGAGFAELFGRNETDRRRNIEHGIAFPLRTGREGVGSVVVFGSHQTLEPEIRERLLWLTVDAGPRIAAAANFREAEQQALVDPLTGLANRRALERSINTFGGAECALLAVDIDRFKQINDSFGHQAGDQTLKHVARVFKRTLREGDVAARIGGEEFALWLPGAPLKPAQDVAERVRAAVESHPSEFAGAQLPLTCSIGLATVPDTVKSAKNLLAAADAALYQAKNRGRNRVETAQPG